MRKVVLLCALAVLCLVPTLTSAQDGYFADWFARVDKTKDEQPHWVTPLATTTPRLEEEYRYEQLWQTNAKGITTDNFDGGKGLELIPFEKVEAIFNVPPYLVHNDPTVPDGFGDVAFLVKYRLISANEEHGNYILTAFVSWSLPTGDHKNGALHAVITPTIAYGKGFGNFDLQGTFGVGLPTVDTTLVGRNYAWNNTFQYRVFRKFWPEVELNSTFFQDGKNDGQKQNFVTPGLVMGRFRLWGRVGFTAGRSPRLTFIQATTTRFFRFASRSRVRRRSAGARRLPQAMGPCLLDLVGSRMRSIVVPSADRLGSPRFRANGTAVGIAEVHCRWRTFGEKRGPCL